MARENGTRKSGILMGGSKKREKTLKIFKSMESNI